jgi:putative drug exporter of the RND superfamily
MLIATVVLSWLAALGVSPVFFNHVFAFGGADASFPLLAFVFLVSLGVVVSAGLVLAGTFAALATLPLTMMTELGFAVAFGVLLDTIVVRSVLVTALNLDLGRWVWWPSALARSPVPESGQLEERPSPAT